MRWAAAIALVALAAGCDRGGELLSARYKPSSNDLPVDADMVAGATSATSARARRMAPDPERKTEEGIDIGEPVPVPPPILDQLQQVIATPRFTMPYECFVEPGLGVRFEGGSPPVEVVFCFKCGQMVLRGPDRRYQILGFAPQRRAVVAIARALFPDDPEIQALH